MILTHKELRAWWETIASRIITITNITMLTTIQYVLFANYYPPTLIMSSKEILCIAAGFYSRQELQFTAKNILFDSATCWKPLANYDLFPIWCTKLAMAAKKCSIVSGNGLLMVMKWLNLEAIVAFGHPILSKIGPQYSVLNQIESHICGR